MKRSSNSVEDHPQLSHNRHPVDGALVGAGSLYGGYKKPPAGLFVPYIASVNFVCLKQRMQKPCFGLLEGLLNH
jgi:hypothetical protein